MLKMIIADDEHIIIRGIQKMIDWESLGIEVVAAYEDGQSAMNGILSLCPDIALMDIFMPGRNGIEILKELKEMGVSTKVIFISGYQNFAYARDAIRYGAVDYLLKPVIEEELLRALEKCMLQLDRQVEFPHGTAQRADAADEIPYDRLAEPPGYLTACIDILFGRESREERQLILFSVKSFLDKQLGVQNRGIVFEKDGMLAVIINGADKEEGKRYLRQLVVRTQEERHQRLGIVVGGVAAFMNEIPGQYQKCRGMTDYFYFAPYLPALFLDTEEPVFPNGAESKDLQSVIDAMVQALIRQNHGQWEREQRRLFQRICVMADGRKEDACFYLCSSLSKFDAAFMAAGLEGAEPDIGDILQQSRSRESYQDLTAVFGKYFGVYEELIRKQNMRGEKPGIVRAKEYINAHFAENLTLEILAGEIHMNPYYFSAYFKKQAGKNFKEYLNEVRMRHAVALILGTDKMIYEIADEVGYRDSQAFSDAFQKYFGETPSNYKKRMKT